MIEIIPAVMPRSMQELEEKTESVALYAKTVQIDVMDGKFVKGRSWPWIGDKGDFEKILAEDQGLPQWQKIDFEADLMVEHTIPSVDAWIRAGAKRIVVHIESLKKSHEDVSTQMEEIKKLIGGLDIELGIALNPATPIHEITSFLEDIQFVQFMGIDIIGLQGETLNESVIDKIEEFHNGHPEVIISIDGGVTLENAETLIEAGVKRLVTGSAIFSSTVYPAEALKHFKQQLKGIE